MALNFLKIHSQGGGPAHLLENPAPTPCLYISAMNALVAAGGITSIIYGNYVNASFGNEVLQYLFTVAFQGCYSAVYFTWLAGLRVAADNEWSRILITILLLNVIQYGLIIWAAWLTYRMYYSYDLVGTRMYYYFVMGKWMYNAILGISSLNAYCIVYTSYVALVKMFVLLVLQMRRKKHVK